MAVKTRYQSVQGVTRSITKPICRSSELLRKILAKIKPKIGIQIKFITREVIENFISTKPFLKRSLQFKI
jgi:hypothetical protein